MTSDVSPRYAAYDATEKRVGGGVVRVNVPRRTKAEQAAYEARLDAAIRTACPGWRLAKQGGARNEAGRRVGKEASPYGESESE